MKNLFADYMNIIWSHRSATMRMALQRITTTDNFEPRPIKVLTAASKIGT